jgi:hypothetical protein
MRSHQCQHDEVRLSMSANLRAVISQRLIPRRDGVGRVPSCEVLVSTPTVREYILNADKLPLLHGVVAEGVTQYGMQTFDQSVLALLREGLITEEEALRNCNNPNELSLKLKGISATSDRTWQDHEEAARLRRMRTLIGLFALYTSVLLVVVTISDGADIGCNCVLNPGSIIGRNAVLYPNLLWRGVCAADSIVKLRQHHEVVVRRK